VCVGLAITGTNQGLFNNAAQSWNHAFYWNCLKANGGGAPTGKVADMITASFGSYDAFRKEFATAANTAFGSGWGWLVYDPKAKAVKVVKTIGADNPITDGMVSEPPRVRQCDVLEWTGL
jgi:superoxide dismutase, Fe-Mn family